jgi:glycosyltransferase involved in cell wall biosynthesis
MKPRLLYCITNLDFGGAQQHLVRLAACFSHRFDVIVAYGQPGPALGELEAIGIATRAIPFMLRTIAPFSDLRSILRLRAIIREVTPAVVHVHSAKAALLGRVAALGLGVPVVYTVHGWAFKKGAPPVRRAVAWLGENLLARASDEVICVSESEARLARSALLLQPRSLRVIPNGIPDERVAANRRDMRLAAVMVARFQEPKRQDLLLRAMLHVTQPLELRFVGDGPCRAAMQRLAAELGIASRVRFLGERPDVAALLAAADIFVLVSDHEAMPLSVIEAMRAGIPAIASDVGGMAELVEHGVSGLLLRDARPESIGAALASLMADSGLRARMGAAARARFLARHQDSRMIAAIADTYDIQIANAGSRRRG